MVGLAVALAVLSAIGLACGTHFQSVAVVKGSEGQLSLRDFSRVLRSPRWSVGLMLLALGAVCNILALSKAPVTVVQPIGVLGLVITTILHARHVKIPITAATWRAIGLCTGGAILFVLAAVRYTDPAIAVTDRASDIVTYLLVGLITLVCLGMLLLKERQRSVFYLFAAGALYGFVAVEVKVLTVQLHTGTGTWWRNVEYDNVIGLVIAAALGGWLVQSAYASGPPELVMAGLTVVDPMVGVLVGLSVLGEAGPQFGLLPGVVLVACGAVSIAGVGLLSKYHPEVMAKVAAAKAPNTGQLGILPGPARPHQNELLED